MNRMVETFVRRSYAEGTKLVGHDGETLDLEAGLAYFEELLALYQECAIPPAIWRKEGWDGGGNERFHKDVTQ